MRRSRPSSHATPNDITPDVSQANSPKPIWQYPLFWGGLVAALALILIPLKQDQTTQRLLAITANDGSASGLSVPDVFERHCRATVEQLKSGDRQIALVYADRPEVVQDQEIQNTLNLLRECQEKPTENIAQRPGTSPNQMLAEVLTVMESARIRGMTEPTVVTIWLHAAEPVPGEPPFDPVQFQSQVQAITENNGVVTIFGPTGSLQQEIRRAIQTEPRASVCPTSSLEACIEKAYATARSMPPLGTPAVAQE